MNDSLFFIDNFDRDFFFEKIRQRKHTDFASMKPKSFSHPDITKFKKVYNRHTSLIEKYDKCTLEEIHLKKPKIRNDGKFTKILHFNYTKIIWYK